ncbi:sensor histidine kinase [Deinococcus koreensis]|uniref:histidine kinase n=1 Tax=Deinococcus koreensis TaxID=2054903 RepID=A0A2K3USP6_9DEIO|nr:ATP-binding protein [Deinococcus koreensis]PNY79562.1 sensor histidine kinase [Deinococcus koreensis]
MTSPPPLTTAALFQATLDALSAHVAVVEPSGQVVAVNRAWAQFCTDNGGSETSCGVGSNYLAVCGDAPETLEDAPVMTRGLLEVLRGERPDFALTYPCHAPHERRWFRARIVPVRYGPAITHAVVSHENITERELGQVALQESEARFEALADITPVGIVVGDMEGRLEYANDAYLRLVGFSRSELEAGTLNWLTLTPPEWRHTDERAAAQVTARGLSDSYEKEYVLRDGRRVPVMLALARSGWDGHERLCGYVLDLTERKEIEGALRNLNTRLEALVEERTGELIDLNVELRGYAGAVSRDLQAPVTRIMSLSRLLHMRLHGTLEAREDLQFEHLRAEGQRVAGLLEDLKVFAQEPRPAPLRAPLPLGPLVLQVRSDLEALSRGRRIEWSVGDLPTVFGDHLRLRHALTQLLHNALKFTRHRPVAHIEIGAHIEGHQATLRIQDNGVGFPAEQAAELFQVFRRLHGEQFEGAGVGLANVRRIARQHGGQVWAQGEPDVGATFFLALPLAPGGVLSSDP